MKILIETNENEYMISYQMAGESLFQLIKDHSIDEWSEKKIKDNFIALTKAFYFVLKEKGYNYSIIEYR